MRLENILALTNAELINTPFVKKFENIVFEIKHLKRGDLFIAFDEDMIETAVSSGAYGIIFDKPTQITDTEIAWIKVSNCEGALKRLLRFKLIEKNICVYECNEIILKLALQIMTDSNFIVVNGGIQSIYKQLWNLENGATLLFCPKMSDPNIFTDVRSLHVNKLEKIQIMEKTLFETSFIYDNTFYERQLISPFFIPYLEELLYLYKTLKINYRLRKFTSIEHFEAVFINKKFEIKEFGTSDKVLIFESDAELIESEMTFLQNNATWANLIFILPESDDRYSQYENIYTYKSQEKIISILQKNQFHFALVVGVNKSILSTPVVNQAQLFLDL